MKNGKSSWYLWIFPLLALLVSGYLFYKHNSTRGKTIKVSFDEASSIEVQKTKLKYRGVEIGAVEDVSLSVDRKNVLVSIVLRKEANSFAVEGSRFWVVTPKASIQGFSGLDTILTGPYIEAIPGPADGDVQTEFKARMDSEIHDPNEGTVTYFLETPSAESITSGANVTYRGITVGNISRLVLNNSGQDVSVQINIQSKYVKLIRSNTVFWRKVGIQANLGLFGSDIKVNSLDSIMRGGIEFATPNNPTEIAKSHTKFGLASEAPKNSNKWNPKLDL